MMERRLEPELMEDPEGTAAYARADFHDSSEIFLRAVVASASNAQRAVDLGCGPGQVTIQLARALPGVAFTAVDGSGAMIALARQAVLRAGLEGRIALVQARLQGLTLPAAGFDAVLSKDLLHHLPDPSPLWTEVARLGRPGAVVCVMDLVRPPTADRARQIVDTVAPTADEILRQDFYNSLLAAFTLDDVRAQLKSGGLGLDVEQVSDRHMIVSGRLRG